MSLKITTDLAKNH